MPPVLPDAVQALELARQIALVHVDVVHSLCRILVRIEEAGAEDADALDGRRRRREMPRDR